MATSEVRANRAATIRSRAGSYSGLAAAAILAIAMGVGLNVAIFNGSLQNFGAGGPELARAGFESGPGADSNKAACPRASATDNPGSDVGAIPKSPASRPASSINNPRRSRLKTAWDRSTTPGPSGNSCSIVTGDFIRSLMLHLVTDAAVDRVRGRISSLLYAMTVAGRVKVDLSGE